MRVNTYHITYLREQVELALKTHAEHTWRDIGKSDRYDKEKVVLGLAFFELKLRMLVPKKNVMRLSSLFIAYFAYLHRTVYG